MKHLHPHPCALRRSVILSAAGLLAGLSAGAARADVLDTVLQAKRLRISIDPAAPPYSSKNESLSFVGSEVDIAQQLAKDWGVALEIVPTSPANRIPFLLTDKTDLVISTLSITPEREKVIAFSRPYSAIQVVVGAPRSTKLSRVEELAGKTVATVRGSTNDAEISKLASQGVQVLRFDDDATAITAIVSGQVDLFCTAPALLRNVNRVKPALAMEPKIALRTNLTGIGLRKGETRLKEKVDAWVLENLNNNRLAAIYRQHNGADLPAEVAAAVGR